MPVTYTNSAPTPPPPPPASLSPPLSISMNTKQVILDFDKWSKRRLSKHFLVRDFLFSSRAEILEKSNRPSDDPDMFIKAGKALCNQVLEPLIDQFGPLSITYGYQSRELIEAGYPQAKPHSSAPHQWDRGTFGNQVYARVDILPYAVEIGQVSKLEYGQWMMHNLDIDLLMQWKFTNVFCVTIGPKPRRVYLEWTPKGQGANGSNQIMIMGEHYWNYVWPDLPEDQRPKFGPSITNGSMSWS